MHLISEPGVGDPVVTPVSGRWLRVDVPRDSGTIGNEYGVTGYAEGVPVTSFAYLAPGEVTVYVEYWGHPMIWSIQGPKYSGVADAAPELHRLLEEYGGTPHDTAQCACVYPLGYMARFWDALNVEASVLSTMRQPAEE